MAEHAAAVARVDAAVAHAAVVHAADAYYAAKAAAADAYYVARAADTARAAARAAAAARPAADAADADAAAAYAAPAAVRAGVDVPHIRSDFELVLQFSQRENWTDATPVPPSIFPPLDAKPTPPAVTPEELAEDETIRIRVRFLGKPGTTAAELAPHIRATYQALNEYTLAKYGKHLKLADFKRLVLQYAGVPA